MSGERGTSIRWPLYVTAWASTAGIFAGQDGKWVVVVCAVLVVLSCWALYAMERRP